MKLPTRTKCDLYLRWHRHNRVGNVTGGTYTRAGRGCGYWSLIPEHPDPGPEPRVQERERARRPRRHLRVCGAAAGIETRRGAAVVSRLAPKSAHVRSVCQGGRTSNERARSHVWQWRGRPGCARALGRRAVFAHTVYAGVAEWASEWAGSHAFATAGWVRVSAKWWVSGWHDSPVVLSQVTTL